MRPFAGPALPRLVWRGAARRAAGTERPHAPERKTFYESDCQGQFSSLLIAFSSSPLQSAPSVRSGTNESASGLAE